MYLSSHDFDTDRNMATGESRRRGQCQSVDTAPSLVGVSVLSSDPCDRGRLIRSATGVHVRGGYSRDEVAVHYDLFT